MQRRARRRFTAATRVGGGEMRRSTRLRAGVWRLKSELLSAADGPRSREAERCLLRSLELSRAARAKSLSAHGTSLAPLEGAGARRKHAPDRRHQWRFADEQPRSRRARALLRELAPG